MSNCYTPANYSSRNIYNGNERSNTPLPPISEHPDVPLSSYGSFQLSDMAPQIPNHCEVQDCEKPFYRRASYASLCQMHHSMDQVFKRQLDAQETKIKLNIRSSTYKGTIDQDRNLCSWIDCTDFSDRQGRHGLLCQPHYGIEESRKKQFEDLVKDAKLTYLYLLRSEVGSDGFPKLPDNDIRNGRASVSERLCASDERYPSQKAHIGGRPSSSSRKEEQDKMTSSEPAHLEKNRRIIGNQGNRRESIYVRHKNGTREISRRPDYEQEAGRSQSEYERRRGDDDSKKKKSRPRKRQGGLLSFRSFW